MDGSRGRQGEVASFLQGEPAQLASIETAVTRVVKSFQFRDLDLDRDLVQDTLSRILLNLSDGRFRGEASLKTYARNVARFTCLEHIRRRRWEVEIDPESHSAEDRWSAPEQSFLWAEEHLRNLELFAALPAECRNILRLICLEGVSYREVAGRLGISEAAVKSRIHRCRLVCREAAGLGARSARRGSRRSRP